MGEAARFLRSSACAAYSACRVSRWCCTKAQVYRSFDSWCIDRESRSGDDEKTSSLCEVL